MRIQDVLDELGLGRNKGVVYMASLAVGTGPVVLIAKEAGLPRTTTHEILQGLSLQGLVSFVTRGRTQVYTAASPEKLRQILHERERRLERVLPELLALVNTGGVRPHVRFYEGVEGIKAVFEDTLTVSDGLLRGILSMENLYAVPGKDFMDDYIRRRVASDIRLRVVRSRAKEVGEEAWPTSIGELRELRYAPAELVFTMTVYVYGDTVSVMGTEKEQFGMIVSSPDLAQTFRNLFEVLWRVSK